MGVQGINPSIKNVEQPSFSKILSKREKDFLEQSFPTNEKLRSAQKPKEFIGKYIDIKV